jgi:FkbM family methyltransferase
VPRRKVTIGEINFTLPCDNWITHFRWYLIHKKEPEVRMFIDKYVRDSDVFFDIGANIGIYSIYASKRFTNLEAICFEPEFSNLHYLKQNIIENHLIDQMSAYSIAISDKVGTSKLYIQDTMPGAAIHSESIEKIETTAEGLPVVWSEGIIAYTLDAIVQELNKTPNIIKIDTDGNEAKILRGAPKLLKNTVLRSLILEIPENKQAAEECIELLTKANFMLDWTREDSRNQIWVRKDKIS